MITVNMDICFLGESNVLSDHLFVWLFLFSAVIFFFVSLFVCIFVCLFVCLFVSFFACFFVCLNKKREMLDIGKKVHWQ